ncbi:MAG: X2-like carbohydrate binding domain-containing protein [Dehalococcoidia bacterium]
MKLEKGVKEIMEGKFRAITQVSLALLLALGLSLVPLVPVMAVELPSISPTTAQYDLDDPAEVMTTITWGAASKIDGISDGDGDLSPGLGKDYIVLVKTLIILNSYLEGKLTDIGDEVELLIEFDVGAATFTITAIGTQPSISPTTDNYDLDDPADVETTITWGIAGSVQSITENGSPLTSAQYTVGSTVGGKAPLTIRSGTYLAGKLTDIGDEVVLTIGFDVGNDATFTITAIGTQPSISPTTAQYDLDDPDDVSTTITLGSAASVVSVTDDVGPLTKGALQDYTVVGTTLTVLDGYLEDKLINIGDEVVLTIGFDVGNDATFTITAIGTQPSVSPTTANYDLDSPADVETTIYWGTAAYVVSITENGNPLTLDTHYTVTDIDPGVSAKLTILNGAYLEGKLTDIGDKVVLTIDFDFGNDATFTITATGVNPAVSPSAEIYDLDAPANVETTITWGTATEVDAITANGSLLTPGVHYTLGATVGGKAPLTILHATYLEGKLTDIDDKVVVTIDFDFGADATLTITATGIQPSISPPTATYDLLDWHDVTTTISWGSATRIDAIVDDGGYTLEEGIDYTVTDILPGVSADLTILWSTYLMGKLRNFGHQAVLTIDFDVGRDATFTITVPSLCFIATAAYGTPMAEEIQILREFRDKYLLTNPAGQALVDLYYRSSPPVARFIAEHPGLKPVVRTALLPAVVMSAVVVNTSPVEKTAILGLLVLVSAALAVWATRRRGRRPEYS